MDDKQNRACSNGADGDPSLFVFGTRIAHRNRIGVVEDEDGRLETDAAFAEILAAFVVVPFNSHQSDANRIGIRAGVVNTSVRTSNRHPAHKRIRAIADG
jgi:hypothetical protein